jgi:hypothetical protein
MYGVVAVSTLGIVKVRRGVPSAPPLLFYQKPWDPTTLLGLFILKSDKL